MAGYISSFQSIDGELIGANLFTQEYDNLGIAFDASTGHTHDGTAANGALIPKISASLSEVSCGGTNISFSTDVGSVKTLQLAIGDGVILPAVSSDVNLGSDTFKFKDGYLTTVKLGATTVVDAILNDGTMAASSPTALVTQASVVTYTATEIGAAIIDGGAYPV